MFAHFEFSYLFMLRVKRLLWCPRHVGKIFDIALPHKHAIHACKNIYIWKRFAPNVAFDLANFRPKHSAVS